MTKDRNALRAGLFILIATALVIGVIISIKGAGRFAEGRVSRVAEFQLTDDVGGLSVGDEVRVGGLKVGTVDSIEAVGLDGDSPRIQVAFSLPGRFKLRQDARVGIQQTLTGSTSLNIDYLGKGTEYAAHQVIPGRPDPKNALLASLASSGGDLEATMKDIRAVAADIRGQTVPKANAALDSFKGTGDSATALVGDVREKVPGAIDKYNGVADKTGTMMQSITDMIGPSTTDWKGLIANLNTASGAISQKLPGMLDRLEKTLEGAEGAMKDIQQTIANAKDATGSLKTVLGNNEGKLDSMLAGLKVTGDNLKAASAEIRRSPWRLLYKPAPNEVANLNVYDSARQFAEGANDLNDAATSLRDALKTGNASEKDIKAMMERLEQSFTKFREVEGKLWSEVK